MCTANNLFLFTLCLVANLITLSAKGQYDFKDLDQVLSSKKSALGGKLCMLVYKDGKVIYENNLGYDKNSIEPIASCSKWFTAALLMTFVEEKKISLDDTLGKFLPLFSKNKKGKIKIRHCLSHTTGIQGEQITLSSVMNRNKYKSLEEEVNDFALRPVVAKPGDQFYYGNIGLNIAGRVIEIVGGKNFETLFQERLAKPLQMKSTTFINEHAMNPSGGALSSPADYMNFLVMMLNKGSFSGKRILNEESVAVMHENHTEEVKVVMVPEQAEGLEYGFGEWILEFDEDDNTSVVSSPGILGTFPYIDLSRDYAAILFVKTLKVKDRNLIYKEVKGAVDKVID